MSSHAATITPTKDALIDSGKLVLPKAKPSKINTLDSRLRGNDDFSAFPSSNTGHAFYNRQRLNSPPGGINPVAFARPCRFKSAPVALQTMDTPSGGSKT
jgi:hypothetical protein